MDVKDTIAGTVMGARERLTELSHRLHAHPEVAWSEERAAAWVSAELADAGFDVEAGACGLPTAFIARTGTGPLHVGICAEYDALPGLGHACGHNIIAAAAVGAGLALAAAADDLGLTVTVFGTPAEEGGGGKVYMLERGAFRGVHAAMMVHPGPVDVAEARPFAVSHMLVRYRGQATHAAAYPERGVNAADAFTIAQVAIGLLRQQLPPSTRVHGIITHGGDAPNIIPDRTEGRWYARAETLHELAALEPRVRRCFAAGALATGCELEIEVDAPPYAEFRNDPDLLPLYRANAERLGRRFAPPEGAAPGAGDPGAGGSGAGTTGDAAAAGRMNRASTDMGNVSLIVPSIHPYIGIGSLPAVNHQKEFAAHCVSPAADQALVDGAIALAWTAADAALDETVRGRLLAGDH
ncbi:MAG: M20 family metallopeptidase [Streptosporangiaceae bacterium]|jgi:amidohydrolase